MQCNSGDDSIFKSGSSVRPDAGSRLSQGPGDYDRFLYTVYYTPDLCIRQLTPFFHIQGKEEAGKNYRYHGAVSVLLNMK